MSTIVKCPLKGVMWSELGKILHIWLVNASMWYIICGTLVRDEDQPFFKITMIYSNAYELK